MSPEHVQRWLLDLGQALPDSIGSEQSAQSVVPTPMCVQAHFPDSRTDQFRHAPAVRAATLYEGAKPQFSIGRESANLSILKQAVAHDAFFHAEKAGAAYPLLHCEFGAGQYYCGDGGRKITIILGFLYEILAYAELTSK
ncbi:MAG: hypothetical protein ABR956_03350 [Terracidiphilus sp.]|jgi:hypothetical protein